MDEKSRKKNDQDEVDGMKQEVDSKGKVMQRFVILSEEDEGGRVMVTTDEPIKNECSEGAEWRSTCTDRKVE